MKEIHCFSPKGGVGKSTCAISLAGYYAIEKKLRVCVVDCDVQKTIIDIYQNNLSGFYVRTIAPSPSEGFDVVIYDHHPTHDTIKLGGVVVCPIKPSRADFESYRRGRSIIGDTPHILVINQWSSNAGDDKDFIKKVGALCKANALPTMDIKQRSIYKRATNNAQTIYDMGKTLYGVRAAQKEINKLAEMIDDIQP